MLKQPNILVVGDLMIDHYLWGKCERISPEAPVQVVDIQKESTVLGGAGNVVNNLIALGSKVCVYSVIGDDEVATELKNMLDKLGAESFLVEEKMRKTSKKSRIMASHSQILRYDKESKEEIQKISEELLVKKLESSIKDFDLVLISDYGKGILTQNLCQMIINLANKNAKKVLVDPKGEDYSKYRGAFLLTPNKKEAELATNIKITDENLLKLALEKLKQIANLEVSMITLSEDGIAFLENEKVTIKPTVAREVYDVTGAGDTVIASLAYSLAQEKNLDSSVEFANLAAGVVVGKLGSATVSLEEIEEYKTSLNKSSIEFHIKTFGQIQEVSQKLKEKNKKIVFTNGCFDILHKGHVSYLDIAKSFGDVLILGLNSDESIKRLKGQNRPVNNQDDRAFVLCALECVDYVVIFEQDTPLELIKLIKPDVLVKGADYENREVVGSEIAKETKLVEFVENKSTTNIIEKIKLSY